MNITDNQPEDLEIGVQPCIGISSVQRATMSGERFRAKRLEYEGMTSVTASSRRAFARHAHDEFGIGLIFEGAQRSWSGRGSVEAEAGDIITVNAGEVHDGEPIGDSRSWAMVYISPARMADLVSDISEGRHSDREFAAPVLRDRQVAAAFTAAYAALTTRDGEASEEHLLSVVASLLADPAGPRTTTPPAVVRAIARIDSDPAAAHSLRDLARLTGASRFQTLRGFARETGLTPHSYVVQRRLDLARAMIRRGHGLADVAVSAGFADQSHFHRSFVQRYGLTPGAYAHAMR